MKILFVVDQFPKLSETFVLNQITGLIDQGHEVEILAQKPRSKEVFHEDIKKYSLINKTIYYNVPSKKEDILKESFRFLFNKFFNNPILLFKSLNFLKYGKEALYLRHILVLKDLISEKRPLEYDIIHCHFGPNGLLATILRDLGIIKGKVYTTFHGYDMTTYLKYRGNNIYNFLFSKGDVFLPISDFWKQKLKTLGCEESKIMIHPMGVDINKFSPVKSKLKGTIKLLSVARFVEKKGIKFAIDAVSKLINEGYDVEYSIIGDGPLKAELQTQVANSNTQDRIKFLGWKKQEDAILLIERSDIFLAPSIIGADGDMEGIPVVLMEAMAMQKVVISTYHSGIPELIINNENGFLVPEKDSDAIYEKIKFIIENDKYTEKICYSARESIEDKHNITTLNKKLERLFESVV
ncbi:glycosyltransferase [Ectobacillus panaciterrae]|uniref:glycosyltransferase n=1 Tax=Ectobacillus panaciterrae TaxID=363872 RepID=UPI00040D47B8|nr:glycosyltransferase [Ectobacillus panaciterrae]